MITEAIKSIKSGKAELRQFGIVMCVALGVFGVLFWWRGKGFYPYLLGFSGAFLFFGLAWPLALKPVHRVWMAFAIVLGWFMSRLILSLFFYIVLTPIGFFGRLFGWDPLALRFRVNAVDTYWTRRESRHLEAADYEKRY